MSIDWTAVETAVATLITDATGLRAVKRDGARPFAKSPTAKALALYQIISRGSVGADELRYAGSGASIPDPDQVPTAVGLRHVSVSIQVESYTQAAALEASSYLEALRTYIRLPQALAGLHAAGLAIIEAMPTIPLPYAADDRVYSRAAMDLRFALADDRVGDAIQSIERVIVSSELRGVDGTILPVPPNVLNQEVP